MPSRIPGSQLLSGWEIEGVEAGDPSQYIIHSRCRLYQRLYFNICIYIFGKPASLPFFWDSCRHLTFQSYHTVDVDANGEKHTQDIIYIYYMNPQKKLSIQLKFKSINAINTNIK